MQSRPWDRDKDYDTLVRWCTQWEFGAAVSFYVKLATCLRMTKNGGGTRRNTNILIFCKMGVWRSCVVLDRKSKIQN